MIVAIEYPNALLERAGIQTGPELVNDSNIEYEGSALAFLALDYMPKAPTPVYELGDWKWHGNKTKTIAQSWGRYRSTSYTYRVTWSEDGAVLETAFPDVNLPPAARLPGLGGLFDYPKFRTQK